MVVEESVTVTKFIKIPSSWERQLVVRAKWFYAYIAYELGDVVECENPRIGDEASITLLGVSATQLAWYKPDEQRGTRSFCPFLYFYKK